MKLRKTQIIIVSSFFVSAYLLWLNFLFSFSWALSNQVSMFKFLHYGVGFYVPFILFQLSTISLRHSKWRSLFSWRIWIFPVSVIIGFSLSMWRFDPILNMQTEVLGYNWQWVAIFTWASLFLSLLFLFQYRKMDKLHAFALSFFSVHLASILYELPWNLSASRWQFLLHPKFFVSLLGMALLLYTYRWHPSKLTLLAVLPVLALWLAFYSLPYGSSWLPRLSTFPFFLSIAFNIKAKDLES